MEGWDIMPEKDNSILIIEDSELNVKILVDILGEDYKLYIAKNGQEGVEKAKEKLPDLILLDIVMPTMDGYEAIGILKDTWETQEIPIIFLTSLNNVEDERKGLMLGADDYINKPFDPLVVKLRVDIQMRIVNQLKTIRLLSEEVESWMKSVEG